MIPNSLLGATSIMMVFRCILAMYKRVESLESPKVVCHDCILARYLYVTRARSLAME